VSNIVPALPPSLASPEGGSTRRGTKEGIEEGGRGVKDGNEASSPKCQELEARQPAVVSSVVPALPPSLANPQVRGH